MQQNELQHYGVPGMRWGIRRGRNQITRAKTKEEHEKGVSTLTKHRGKAVRKVAKLEKKGVKLDKAYNKAVLKTDPKIAKLDKQIGNIDRKLNKRPNMSDKKARRLITDQVALEMKINDLQAKSSKAKTAYAKNERLKEIFNKGISDIDDILAKAGRKYING